MSTAVAYARAVVGAVLSFGVFVAQATAPGWERVRNARRRT